MLKLATVSFSGLEGRKGNRDNEIEAERSLFPSMIMGGKFNKSPTRAALVWCYLFGWTFLHSLTLCLWAESPVPETSDGVESDAEL